MKKLFAATATPLASIFGSGFLVKGLQALAKLEDLALGATLLIIVALLVGFASYDVKAFGAGIEWPDQINPATLLLLLSGGGAGLHHLVRRAGGLGGCRKKEYNDYKRNHTMDVYPVAPNTPRSRKRGDDR